MRAHIILTLVVSVLALTTGCAKHDHSEDALKLRYELRDLMYKNPEQALVRIDSAERVGLFTAANANVIRANVYARTGQRRLAIYYGEQILHDPQLKSEGRPYYSALLQLNGLLEEEGEYGKAIRLADEIIADVENELEQGGETSDPNYQVALRMKSHSLIFKGECESNLGHPEEAEHFYLEGIELMMEGMPNPNGFWEIDALFYGILEATDFYLERGMPEKALPLAAKGDTAMARLARCPDVPDYILTYRSNNITVSQAMIYAANGLRDKAEALYLKHRQSEGLTEIDIAADARYLAMTGRYNEAIRLFRQADSIYLAKNNSVSTSYIKFFLMRQYDALQKAGRKDETLALSNRIRHLTDSVYLQDRRTDVEQIQEIRQKEAEIASRRQALAIHRIIIIAAIIIILLVGYLLVRAYIYNKALEAKNRSLYQEIQQREKARADEHEALQAQPVETLSQNQQLYLKLCQLMDNPDVFTDPDTNQDTLANLAGTNRTYIYDALHECAGVTPADFINGYRLRYAAGLLSTTDDSIALIAELCGLSRRTFYRLFDEAYAMSPSEYRKVAKK